MHDASFLVIFFSERKISIQPRKIFSLNTNTSQISPNTSINMIQCFSNIFFFSKEQYFFTLPPEIFLYYSLSLYFRLYSFLKNNLSPVVKKYSILIPFKLVPIPQSYNSKLLECFLLF